MPTAADYRAAFGDPQTLAKAAGGTNALKTAASAMSLQNAMATRKKNQRALQKDMFEAAFNVASAAKSPEEWDTIFTNLAKSAGFEEASQYVGRWKDKDDILAVAAARIFDPTSTDKLVRGDDGSYSIETRLSATQTRNNKEIDAARERFFIYAAENPLADYKWEIGYDDPMTATVAAARRMKTLPSGKRDEGFYKFWSTYLKTESIPVPGDLSNAKDGTIILDDSTEIYYVKRGDRLFPTQKPK